MGNNPWGMGLGLQLYLRSQTKLRPLVEITGTAYLVGDKVLHIREDWSVINEVDALINTFAGVSYHPFPKFYGAVSMGPSFINGDIHFGIHPSLGYFFSRKERVSFRLAYLHVFNRDKPTGSDFSSMNLSMGIRLF